MTFLRLAMEERGVIIVRMLMSISFSFFYSVYSSYSERHEAGASVTFSNGRTETFNVAASRCVPVSNVPSDSICKMVYSDDGFSGCVYCTSE